MKKVISVCKECNYNFIVGLLCILKIMLSAVNSICANMAQT